MINPLVSIIIPTYNRAHLISETMDSIVAQTYTNWECIIVDDGSTDATEEVVQKYCDEDSRFQFYKRPEGRPKGANACRNYGFEVSKGEYINWFDSDDLMLADKLEVNSREFIKNPYLDMCFSKANYFEINANNILYSTKSATKNLFQDYVLKKISISCQVPMWRKSFLSKTNLFNESTLRGQEFEFYSEIFFNYKINYKALDIPLVSIRLHEDSITSTFNSFDVPKLVSYCNVTNRVLKYISSLNDDSFFEKYIKILYKDIFIYIRAKQYSLAYKQSKMIFNNAKVKNFNIVKNHLVIGLMVLLKGKGYYQLKRLIK